MQRNFIIGLVGFANFAAAAEFPKDVRERGAEATVQVISKADDQIGSGVLIMRHGPHAYVLTAYHVVERAKNANVRFVGGKMLQAEVLARSVETDLAILRLENSDKLPRAIALALPKAKPTQVISLGWPKGDAPSSLEEMIKSKVQVRRPGAEKSVWSWEVARKPAQGCSGGALLDRAGTVVGIASGHDGDVGYFVHVDEVHAFLRRNALKWLTEEDR